MLHISLEKICFENENKRKKKLLRIKNHSGWWTGDRKCPFPKCVKNSRLETCVFVCSAHWVSRLAVWISSQSFPWKASKQTNKQTIETQKEKLHQICYAQFSSSSSKGQQACVCSECRCPLCPKCFFLVFILLSSQMSTKERHFWVSN